ncbi:MAG TPA: sulfatase/phosphatase domain-containing protein, partial [Limnochordia bacterium]
VPEDLRAFPGDWLSQLPDYYGCIARIDECIGRLFAVLAEEGLMANTIVAFFSDHGCHFRTRNGEYKRSCHDASVRVPLLFQGPGFDRRLVIPEIASLVDVAPTLLDAANLPIPHTMQGQSLMPLVRRKSEGWRNEAFIQISESCVGRALRTERWTYAVTAPGKHGGRHPSSDVYVETHLYDNFADPHQLTNLVGRREYRSVAAELRERLVVRMVEIGEKEPEIQEAPWYAT